MTTIIYKKDINNRHIIYGDGRVTQEGTIITENYKKVFNYNNFIVGFAGYPTAKVFFDYLDMVLRDTELVKFMLEEEGPAIPGVEEDYPEGYEDEDGAIIQLEESGDTDNVNMLIDTVTISSLLARIAITLKHLDLFSLRSAEEDSIGLDCILAVKRSDKIYNITVINGKFQILEFDGDTKFLSVGSGANMAKAIYESNPKIKIDKLFKGVSKVDYSTNDIITSVECQAFTLY